jgi:hypothetical protein
MPTEFLQHMQKNEFKVEVKRGNTLNLINSVVSVLLMKIADSCT